MQLLFTNEEMRHVSFVGFGKWVIREGAPSEIRESIAEKLKSSKRQVRVQNG